MGIMALGGPPPSVVKRRPVMRTLRAICMAALLAAPLTVLAQFETSSEVNALKTKAAAGDPVAQFALGMAYHDGKGVPTNDVTAAGWIRKSADQGYAPAQNELGVLYRMGEGVEPDKEEAVRWLR